MKGSKGFVLGFMLSVLLFGIVSYASNQYLFRGSVTIPERENVRIEGIEGDNGEYGLEFGDMVGNYTESQKIEIVNAGSGDATYTFQVVEKHDMLEIVLDLYEGNYVKVGEQLVLPLERTVKDGESFTIERGTGNYLRFSAMDMGAEPGTYNIDIVIG